MIVFFITARQTQFVAEAAVEVFKGSQNKELKNNLFEIHSRKSQGARNKASDEFRGCANGIMFSSDVSARGLDYPGVTHVVQVNAPSSREQYLHRLGRTARAGGSGKGVLVLHDWEDYFLKQEVSDLWKKMKILDWEADGLAAAEIGRTRLEKAVRALPDKTRQVMHQISTEVQ